MASSERHVRLHPEVAPRLVHARGGDESGDGGAGARSTQAPESHALIFQKLPGAGAVQHGERGEDAGLGAGVRHDRDRARGVGHRPAAARTAYNPKASLYSVRNTSLTPTPETTTVS